MDHQSNDNITSWFVRRRTSAVEAAAQDKGDSKQKGKGHERKEQAAGSTQQQQQSSGDSKQHRQKQGAPGPDTTTEKKSANPLAAAAAAVAAVAAEKKAGSSPAAPAKKAAAAEDSKHAAGAPEEKKASAAAAEKKAAAAPAEKKPAAAAPGEHPAEDKKRSSKPAAAPPATDSDSDDEQLLLAGGGREQQQGGDPQQQQQQQQQRAAEEVDEDAEYRPRVVAYSDSDSDVESHFKRVKTHLLPPSEEETAERAAAEAAAAAAAAAQEAAAAEAARQQAGLRRLTRAVGAAADAAARAAAPHMTPGLAARAAGLLLLQRAHPQAALAAGLLGAAAPLAEALALKAGLDVAAALPGPLLAASQELRQLSKAAVALGAGQLLLAGLRRRRRRRRERHLRRTQARQADAAGQTDADAAGPAAAAAATPGQAPATPGRLLRRKSSVNLAALGACAELGAAIEARQPQTAAEWAAVYHAEMQEMRRMLQENEVELPADRFDATNAELLRFAKACGLLTAKTPEQRAAALEAGVSRVVHTQEWAAQQRFMGDRELRRWDRLAAWRAHDAAGRPILLARVGRAQQLVKPERYDDLATAVLTLVHRGLTSQLSNLSGPAEQMVVVLDCRGSSSIGLTRHMGALKKLAVALNQHYPDRLHRLHLLELPLLLRWALHAVTPLLHPTTRSKLVFSAISDTDMPVTVALLSKRRSVARAGSLRRSISNCSFPSSGDATPALLSPKRVPSPRRLPSAGAQPALAEAASGLVAALASSSRGGASAGSSGAALPSAAAGSKQQAVAADEEPNTPPPTLKVPQSPRELSWPRAKQQQQQEPQAKQQGWGPGLGQRARAPPPSPFVKRRSLEQQAAAPGGTPLRRPEHPNGAGARGSEQGAAGVQADAAAAAGVVPEELVVAAMSAAAGITSHAVPWSPGMQSPSGHLSRNASYGEEPVPAASAKAAADAARELEQWQQRQAAATAVLQAKLQAASGSKPGQQTLHRLRSCGASGGSLPVLGRPASAPGAMPSASDTAAAGVAAASSGSSLAGWLGGLLPGHRGSSSGSRAEAQQHRQQPRQGPSRRQLAPRLPLASALAGSREGSSGGSTPRTPLSASSKKACGLVELPERPLRLTPGRRQTPRKSSLRRSESADSLPTCRLKLGSHPLRRQSSVSWAEELEMIKEIRPWGAASALSSPSRGARLAAAAAAAAQPQVVLMACCIALVTCLALLQRLLLGLAL